jgi:transposase-like protein
MKMNTKELEVFAKKATRSIKTLEDLNDFCRMLNKITIEAASNADMEEHLGYEKHAKYQTATTLAGRIAKSVVKNSRNGMMTVRFRLTELMSKCVNFSI